MTLRFTTIAILFINASFLHAGEMDGEWITVSRIRGGEQQLGTPSEAVIKDGKFNTVREGKLSELGDIKETPDENPAQYNVDMKGDVEDGGKSFHGIFSISGDTMFTCVNPNPNGKRPTEFKSTKENGSILIVWIRKSVAAKIEFPNANPVELKTN